MLTRKHAEVTAADAHVAAVFARECFTYNPDEPSFDLLKATPPPPPGVPQCTPLRLAL